MDTSPYKWGCNGIFFSNYGRQSDFADCTRLCNTWWGTAGKPCVTIEQ